MSKLIDMEIPDPFTEFRIAKYAKQKYGAKYDFFSGEWDVTCGACGEVLNANTRKILTKIRLYHSRNECLNGW